MAAAAVFLGWEAAEALARDDDLELAITIAATVRRAEEITHELQERQARLIRNQIVEALDGKKRGKIT